MNSFKLRKRKLPKLKLKLNYGNDGLVTNVVTKLTSKQLGRLTLYLKRLKKKSDKTRRFCYINAFPTLPLSKKPKGVRMGKGKGKRFTWQTTLKPNNVIIEFKNIRIGRLVYFTRKLMCSFNARLTLLVGSKLVVSPNLNRTLWI